MTYELSETVEHCDAVVVPISNDDVPLLIDADAARELQITSGRTLGPNLAYELAFIAEYLRQTKLQTALDVDRHQMNALYLHKRR